MSPWKYTITLILIVLISSCSTTSDFHKRKYLKGNYRISGNTLLSKKNNHNVTELKSQSMKADTIPDENLSSFLTVQTSFQAIDQDSNMHRSIVDSAAILNVLSQDMLSHQLPEEQTNPQFRQLNEKQPLHKSIRPKKINEENAVNWKEGGKFLLVIFLIYVVTLALGFYLNSIGSAAALPFFIASAISMYIFIFGGIFVLLSRVL